MTTLVAFGEVLAWASIALTLVLGGSISSIAVEPCPLLDRR